MTGPQEFKAPTPEEEIREAHAAQRWLDDPLFRKACDHIRGGLAAQRRAVPVRDTDMHTRLILTEQLFEALVDFFLITAQTGELAQMQLRKQEALRERMKRMFSGNLRGEFVG